MYNKNLNKQLLEINRRFSFVTHNLFEMTMSWLFFNNKMLIGIIDGTTTSRFTCIHCVCVYIYICSFISIVCLQVMRSQRLSEPPLTPWVMLSNTGTVECAHCTCMAGVAETCTHIGALLFKVEATVRIRGTKTVTDEPAYWILPGNLTKIHAEVGHKIDYSTSASPKKILDQNILAEVSTPARRSRPQKRKIPPANLKDLGPLLDTLLEHAKAVGLSGMEK